MPIVERKELEPIAVMRIGAPATLGIPPMTDWMDDIKKVVVAETIIGGGFECDGRELWALDEEAARTFFSGR